MISDFKIYKTLILKNQSIICFLLKLTDREEPLELVKVSLKKCADSAMILGKLNQDLLTLCRGSVTPELNIAYRHLSFPQGEHSKLLFGDDLPRSFKKITETNKVDQCLSKKDFLSSLSGSNISLNSNTSGCNSRNKSFLYGGWGQREKFKPNYQQNNRKNSQEADFRKQVNIITENLKTKKDSFTAGSISKFMDPSVSLWKVGEKLLQTNGFFKLLQREHPLNSRT